MLPHNGEGVAGKSRSRPAPARIVPAIPLSLSRSEKTKSQPQPQPQRRSPAILDDVNGKWQAHGQADVAVTVQGNGHAAAVVGAGNAAPSVKHENGIETQQGGGEKVPESSIDTSVSRSSAPTSTPDESVAPPVNENILPTEPLTSEQTESNSPTEKSSPSTVRKSSDRFEMRQIRTELPPAFIPAEQYTPQSATSSQSRPPPQAFPHGHPNNPSVGSIVFGSRDSAGSSPAPPLSAGSAYLPPRNTQSHGHGHSRSESRGVHGSDPLNQRQQGFGPSFSQPPYPAHLEHPHTHFRYPPREASHADIVSPSNGFGPTSRSESPFSPAGPDTYFTPGPEQYVNGSKHMSHGSRASFTRNARPMLPQTQYHVLSPPPHFPYPELATSFENGESLRGHAYAHFNNRDLADCVLEVADEFGGRQLLEGHRIILCRSPALSAIIRSSDVPTAAALKPSVRLYLTGKQMRVHPVLQAIRYLYGGPLPPFDMYDPTAPPGSFNVSTGERMDNALQHIATGSWLGIAAIAHRGVDMASSLLNWDTVSSALEFALDGGISQMWPLDDGEEPSSTCSSDDSMTKPEAGGTPKYGPYASGLLQRVIEFTVQNIPPNFYIDAAAPPSLVVQRLPAFAPKHESKSSKSDPRLSKIKFGEMSAEAENHQRPSPTATAISSILLSLPFPILRYLLEHFLLTERLGAETVASIMRQIVGEREARRFRAIKAGADNHEYGATGNSLVQNLYWQESVEFSEHSRAGFRLARKRIGVDTPPSSGTESERRDV